MRRLLLLLIILTMIIPPITAQDAQPEMVSVPGTLNSKIGCAGDWQPDCEQAQLAFDEATGLWSATYPLPAGDYEVKVAINGAWDENYGVDGVASGENIPFTVAESDTLMTFSFDYATKLLTITAGEVVEPSAQPAGGEAAAPQIEQPDAVSVPGTINSVIGCSGDWQPDCDQAQLVLDEATGIWSATFDIPAGTYEYKVAINKAWDENYGGAGDAGGPNVVLELTEDSSVTFYYDHRTHWIANTALHEIITAPGSYQDEIGCPGEWQPECMASWLQDPDGDGVYSAVIAGIPAGAYEVKAAVGQTWDENYGADGAAGGANIPFTVEENSVVTFTFDRATNLLSVETGAAASGSIGVLSAHWVDRATILWNVEANAEYTYALHYSPRAELALGSDGVTGGITIPLTLNEAGASETALAKFPHLAGQTALTFPEFAQRTLPNILRSQIAVTAADASGAVIEIAGVQIPGVLDDVYAYDGDLGVTWADGVPTIAVWAPTAQRVRLHLFADAEPATEAEIVRMDQDQATGVWSVTGEADWKYQYYLFEVSVFAPSAQAIVNNLVTDPYSMSLSLNSTRSQIVDLNDPELMPEGWADLEKPALAQPEDIVVYELHIRDFSVEDQSVPEEYRGTYMAFTVPDAAGVQHLQGLQEAGLTHLHLLPNFDIATINENNAEWVIPSYEELAALPPDSEEQQAMITEVRDQDPFNWGYDPYHFNVPEGSYATDPNGTQRILEYRQMVQALNQMGLRVVTDVVYNHTNASGQSERSVFDRIVPGYYHRLNPITGQVETSTCCQNTATEHYMMERFMIDSVIFWTTQYKIDAYRFDLMGHHMLENMVNVREALDSLTLEADGVDGQAVYVYGEGWNFGEVADNTRGVNATQLNLGGTGIGSFNDRLRDAARGGSPFGDYQVQGFINGLYVNPNGITPGTPEEQLQRLFVLTDNIKIGMAGNLREYELTDSATGETITGADVDYNGAPAGYTLDPQENIVYTSKHDNETLFDLVQYKAPAETTIEDRVRMHWLGMDIPMMSQGIPFFQAADDILRSKSFDKNSYNSGDWFNSIDWTYQDNNYGIGLPLAADNSNQWSIQQPLLANPDLRPGTDLILATNAHFREMLQIRQGSPLFHLSTAELVQERLSFLNNGPEQLPGVIVLKLDDTVGDDLDAAHEMIVVVINAQPEAISLTEASLAEAGLTLHPVQAASADTVVQGATFDAATGTFSIPALTTAVFVAGE